MFRYLGIALVVIGVAHCAVGVAVFMPTVRDILGSGVIGAVHSDQPARMAVLWYEMSGLALVAVGVLVDWIVRQQGLLLPLPFCVVFLAMALFLIVLFPRGGAWVLLATAVLLMVGRGFA
jgi:hypothetical protein